MSLMRVLQDFKIMSLVGFLFPFHITFLIHKPVLPSYRLVRMFDCHGLRRADIMHMCIHAYIRISMAHRNQLNWGAKTFFVSSDNRNAGSGSCRRCLDVYATTKRANGGEIRIELHIFPLCTYVGYLDMNIYMRIYRRFS
jgi:hypothetical protein